MTAWLRLKQLGAHCYWRKNAAELKAVCKTQQPSQLVQEEGLPQSNACLWQMKHEAGLKQDASQYCS